MPRPKRIRQINQQPAANWFKPAGVPMRDLDEVCLSLDEVEAMRLADFEGQYQERVAEQMGVSRQTVGRILAAARSKIAEALVEGKAIRLDGGPVAVRDTAEAAASTPIPDPEQGDSRAVATATIAIPCSDADLDNPVHKRFGRAPGFLLCTDDGAPQRVVPNPNARDDRGSGISVVEELTGAGVGTVIVSQVGPKAARALANAGMRVFYAPAMTLGEALAALQKGTLPREP